MTLSEKIRTPIRLRVMRVPGATLTAGNIKEGVGVPRHAGPLITVSGTKLMIDGVPIEGTFTPRDALPKPAAPPFDAMFRDLPLTFPAAENAAGIGCRQ